MHDYETPALLQSAKEKAAASTVYDSAFTRKQMAEEIMKRTGNRITPHSWQLDAAEAVLLKLDCTLIAPTASGKLLAVVLPLLWHQLQNALSDKFVILITPLQVLGAEKVGISINC